MIGKFNSLRDQVVYRVALDGFADGIGDIQTYGLYHHFVANLYGRHYIITVNSVGFVDVESFAAAYTNAEGEWVSSAEAGNRWLELSDAYDAWCAIFEEDDDDSVQ